MGCIKVAERHKEGEKKPTRYYSDKQEKSVVKSLKGKQTKNSGATAFEKGDVLSDDFEEGATPVYEINIFKRPSKNFNNKCFLTCSVQ